MSYGIRYIVENYIARQWTQRDVDQAALFFKCATCMGSMTDQHRALAVPLHGNATASRVYLASARGMSSCKNHVVAERIAWQPR